MLKKSLIVVCLLSMLLVWCLPGSATAQSGACGDNATWSLSADGTLRISGTGKMWDWNKVYVDNRYRTDAPWQAYRDQITKVIIGKGITSVGDYAFYEFEKLTSVSIPEGVVSIGRCAFMYCDLTALTLPEGVEILEDYAFSDCRRLDAISFPDSLTTLGEFAFYGCFDLQSLTVPKGVTSLNGWVFSYCLGLKEVIIHENVTSLENYAFYDCKKLKNIIFLGQAPAMGEKSFLDVKANAFHACTDSSWTEAVKQSYGGTLTWHGHLYENYIYNADATCTADGTQTGTCSACGAQYTCSAPGTAGHKYVNGKCQCGYLLFGDVNGDGKVNMADVAKTFAYVRKKLSGLNSTAQQCADVNTDLKINMADVARIFAHARGTQLLSGMQSTYP